MGLLNDDELARSAVVANCRMNRERNLQGSNGYGRELGFEPLEFLASRAGADRSVGWLDLCCGSGRALIQAAAMVRAERREIEITGVDLVGMFDRVPSDCSRLRLVEASVSTWQPDRAFDLITCVHGLHYVGDKLGLISRAATWLTRDGLFVASLDLQNLKMIDGDRSRPFTTALRQAGFCYDSRRRLISCLGFMQINLPLRYVGGDDTAGPNHTGQPAVDSYYERVGEAGR